ncbi:hypothetical protein [Halobacillus litoralis]|nr:hypothetical protein [Halobacillus litoralis]
MNVLETFLQILRKVRGIILTIVLIFIVLFALFVAAGYITSLFN